MLPTGKGQMYDTFDEALEETLLVLDHPNIVKVTQKEYFNEHLVFVLEWMSGKTMQDVMQTKPYPEEEVHRVMLPLFDAVIYCHSMGVSHQNL